MHFAGGHENKEGLLPAIREAELEASVQGIDGDREFPHDAAPHPCQLQLFLKIKAHLPNVQYKHQNHTNSIYSICTFFFKASMDCNIGPIDPDHA